VKTACRIIERAAQLQFSMAASKCRWQIVFPTSKPGSAAAAALITAFLNIATAPDVSLRQSPKIYVCSEQYLLRVDLQLPDLRALFHSRHLKKNIRSDATLEC